MASLDGMAMKFDQKRMREASQDYSPVIRIFFSRGVRLRMWAAKVAFRLAAWMAYHEVEFDFIDQREREEES